METPNQVQEDTYAAFPQTLGNPNHQQPDQRSQRRNSTAFQWQLEPSLNRVEESSKHRERELWEYLPRPALFSGGLISVMSIMHLLVFSV